jgi:hypothetical protein
MNFGMRVKGPTGAIEIDENSFTMRVVYSEIMQPQLWSTKYVDLPVTGITPQNAAAFVMPVQSLNALQDAQLEPEVFNGFVRVWRTIRGDPYGNSAITITRQRLVVTRFK